MNKAKALWVVLCCWITFPILALWLMLTHPGKCALIWKKEMCGTWWESNQKAKDNE